MKIEFINHASFVIDNGIKRIMCDPWHEGSVFNNGWRLISKTKFRYEDFANIDYIWFSHEHPDHFFPPNLKKIPENFRANITIIFQHTKDKRVLNFCKKLGFKEMIELMPNKWADIHGIKLMNEHFQEGDSWICFKDDKYTYLNTNDCAIQNLSEAKYIKNKIGAVDVLFTQFSYAYWVGNPDQVEERKAKAQQKLDMLKLECDVFQPTVTIPIASYVCFSHEENSYLNDSANSPQKAYDFMLSDTITNPVVLYNGETYTYGEKHDSAASLAKYKVDYDNIGKEWALTKPVETSIEEIQEAIITFLEDMNKNNGTLLKSKLQATNIYLWDHNKSFELSLNEIKEIQLDQEQCDIKMGAESLLFCIKFPYGIDTTQINGRMNKPVNGNYAKFYNFFRVNQLKSRGDDPNNLSFLFGVVYRKVLNKIRLLKI
jgi:L-ascorbate metabolism protein UlaG (beta-lactamase superfamily)